MHHQIVTEYWSKPLAEWAAWMRTAKRAPGTIYQHTYRVGRLAERHPRRSPWTITLDDLVEHLNASEVAPSTQRAARTSIRSFYSWAVAVGRLERSPAALLPPVRVERGRPRPAPDEVTTIARFHRDRRIPLMVELGYRAGLRCCEICRVHADDVERTIDGYALRVLGKGRKLRVVPIESDLAASVLERAEGGWCFPGRIDGHLSASYVSKLISTALPERVTAHQLRHRFGTRAYQLGGKDIRAVQELLGHASIATTQVYTLPADDAVRRAALAAA
ncbi:tyrosine-type recombinase/integrase [Humibacter ginsenosidimutans]|uniref:Tyrosine-type recombinase/integrase n=1 Tax=Humibacter ginsenosidimutans TaxID=2599293 RepID=A0A5B8M1W7_9MICO|nr:tyrosine-type recombinase/integrase [Humibacter ginsenosidimutans]QDZ14256.1 tyrosine-type recombinase/integrase [Humibacter ginsenosidimutans]